MPDADINNFSTAQKDAIRRAVLYWTEQLGMPAATAQSPVLRFVNSDSFGINANGASAHDSTLGKANTMSRIIDGASPTRPGGIDARVLIIDTGGFFLGGSPNQVDGTRTLESVSVHELAHTLGLINRNVVPNGADITAPGTFASNDPFTDLLTNQSLPNNFADFAGPNAAAVFGADVPVQPNDTHTLVPFHTMTRAYFDSAKGVEVDYRNSTGFLPVELAIMRDMGYDLTLSEHFGSAFYQDGTGPQVTAGASAPTKAYGVGVYVQADNLDLLVGGDQLVSGLNGTGVRIGGGQERVLHRGAAPPAVIDPATFSGNTVTIDAAVRIEANGENGIGVLQSAGANNVIVHRGVITANGPNGRGIVFTFGDQNLGFSTAGGADYQVTSDDYANRPMAERVDVTGQIIAQNGAGVAFEIDDSAAFGELNIMQGADIQGNIVSNTRSFSTFDSAFYNEPVLNFGYTPDANGQRTLTPDVAFQFNYDGDIAGTRPFDGRLRGGVTELDGSATFSSVIIDQPATLGGTGVVAASGGLTINGAVNPGNGPGIGTLDIVGNVINSATGTLHIDSDSTGTTPGVNNDLLRVTGTALIAGGDAEVSGDGQEVAAGSVYTFLEADTLTVVTPLTFTHDLVNRTVVGDFDGINYRYVVLRDVAFADLGESFNQMNVGEYLDAVGADPDVAPIIDALNALPFDADVQTTLDQLTGEAYGTQVAARLQDTSAFLDLMTGALRGDTACRTCARVRPHTVGFWTQGYGWGSSIQSDGNARSSQHSAGGSVFGLTKQYDDGYSGGVFYAFDGMRSAVEQLGSSIDTETHRFGLHAECCTYEGFLRLLAMGSVSDSNARRSVAFGAGGATVMEQNAAQMDGWAGSVDLEGGRTLSTKYGCVQPIIGCRYVHLGQDAFTESGGATRLSVSDVDLDIFRSRLGADSMVRLTHWWNTSATLAAFWQHDYLNPVASYNATFVDADQAVFAARGAGLGRDRLTLAPGLNCWQGNVRMWTTYLLDANEVAVLHSGAGGIEFVW
ncbi:Extracellular serine protease precursor [Pirellulimonas nuda]|uniref:Extracellular serine protease n=1 Tax=Pirellulimonas nuda TaxID=2528009 RepID=A0A518D5S6_9BACT|nr:autotransporter outer membrane beta-barrel domain-containing protein [Pirellulimonas nuda]QDU86828.1 Extracellular serine protease precursor [Pirellulimonas nuda]